jgi:hypothetical protein
MMAISTLQAARALASFVVEALACEQEIYVHQQVGVAESQSYR